MTSDSGNSNSYNVSSLLDHSS